MPRHGFGKKKGGYKGPVPGPEGNGEANDHQQTSASQKPAKKPPLTHFLCVPLVTAESRPQLQESLGRFKDDHGPDADLGDGVGVAAAADGEQQAREIPGIPGKGIRPVGTLHLTLGVMSLMSQERLQEAVSLLQSLDLAEMLIAITSSGSTSVLSDPLVISLKSLVSMHPPRKTSILYARPEDPTNRLHPFCDALRALFTKKGLMVEDTRPLKLHATVVNTIYAKAEGRHGKAHRNGQTTTVEPFPGEAPGAPPDTSSGHGPNARAPIRIDATDLLPRYADFLWADGIRVGKIAICKMGAKKIVGEKGDVVDEEYEEVAAAEIKL
ncbi:AKAP7 2'5' RNA ligase-like domain-containing protein [Macrophomina phaseolina]|uniref:AKAP7 2'5' RNA ligase-like domain-containing protein n=1 Tax=Macrophomina phaseolina TaxID=35725 RepID=A0ABQ8GS16_9PEZI|nr:AKAP7 2'5' RNA ligase-like domain-containing protein [Macrophomina phaseolina]